MVEQLKDNFPKKHTNLVLEREWTSLLTKNITSNKLHNFETVSTMESPQITPHPEYCSQCSGKASVSEHKPRQWNISYHKDISRLVCEGWSLSSKQLITCSVMCDVSCVMCHVSFDISCHFMSFQFWKCLTIQLLEFLLLVRVSRKSGSSGAGSPPAVISETGAALVKQILIAIIDKS